MLVATASVHAPQAHAGTDLARYVDPFIGTGGHGHTYPGATLPFGMVQLSPDTRLEGWDGCSGYHYSDGVIYGFSHTHLSGTGIPDYCDILFMPVTGEPKLHNGYRRDPGAGYASRFDKASERAEPGWYTVELADHGVRVELTATERTGFHRFHFPAGKPAHVIVDLVHRDQVLDSALRIVSDTEIEGFRRSQSWARDQVIYFVARFSKPFLGTALASADKPRPEVRSLAGADLKGVLSFGAAGGELLVQVGISAVGADGARRNLDAEQSGWDFAAVRRAARARWNEALGRIEVQGGTEAERTIFYTALYHSMLAPNLFSDVDGRYRGMDGSVYRAEGRRHYTVFSLWDTFRATHPLFTLIEPGRVREFVGTFLAQYQQGGRLPVWELAGNETDCMIGYHSVSVIADAYLKGLRGFDAELALDAMLHSARLDQRGLAAYKRQGFISSEDDGESVSKTLEYAYDDWCIARMAEALGRADVAREFARRSQAWRHLLDPRTLFLRARRDERWVAPFDPWRVDLNYTEANAWQYRFSVPHDVETYIEALGGDEAFVARLDSLFTAESRTTGREQPDITGLIGQYAHGNEPSHHVAWLYHYAGRPDKSAERVQQILTTLYGSTPDGLCGNEDCGQMSSWYVLAAMGLYPVCPGSNEYLLGSPLFSRVTLHPHGGRRFRILAVQEERRSRTGRGARDAPETPRYVRRATWKGQSLRRSFLRHEEIAAGGVLELELGAEPGPVWGRSPQDRPRSRVEGERVLAAPFVRAPVTSFRDSLEVVLDCGEPGAAIHYEIFPPAIKPRRAKTASKAGPAPPARATHDAAQEALPHPTAPRRYTAPFVLRESATLAFFAERDSLRSPVVQASFNRMPHDWDIEVLSVPNPQYTAGGPEALIDGLRGERDWRRGAWQGYQHTDFEAVLDFKRPRRLARAGASFLQDVQSWIWMPRELVLSVSLDGKRYREVARVMDRVPDHEHGLILRDLVADLGGIRARYLKLFARNYGTIPEWHPGHGGGGFIFIDEILVE